MEEGRWRTGPPRYGRRPFAASLRGPVAGFGAFGLGVEVRPHPAREGRAGDVGDLCLARLADGLHAAEPGEQLPRRLRPDAGDRLQLRLERREPALLPLRRDGEAVRLVARALE